VVERLDERDNELLENGLKGSELFSARHERIFRDSLRLIDVLQVLNSFRGVIHIFCFFLADLQLGSGTSDDEVDQVLHGLSVISLILT
jgi:hypothetical protein